MRVHKLVKKFLDAAGYEVDRIGRFKKGDIVLSGGYFQSGRNNYPKYYGSWSIWRADKDMENYRNTRYYILKPKTIKMFGRTWTLVPA